jgi:hypothetical protein
MPRGFLVCSPRISPGHAGRHFGFDLLPDRSPSQCAKCPPRIAPREGV